MRLNPGNRESVNMSKRDDIAKECVDADVEVAKITLFFPWAPNHYPSELHEWVNEDKCFRINSEYMSEEIEVRTVIKIVWIEWGQS